MPVIIGDEDDSARIAKQLKQRGIICPEIKYPAVPKGRARLRISPVCDHTQEDLDYFLSVFQDIVK